MRIEIPKAVVKRANEIAGSGRGQGQRQTDVLREYVRQFVPQNHEVTGYDRTKDGLFAITEPIKPDDPDIPDKFKRKPKR